MILCANGFVHIDQIDDFYQESFLSVLYRKYSFKMGYVALSNLLHDLGLRGNPVRQFEQNLIDACSKDVAIDGHVIRSCSEENDLAELGYKLNLLNAPQVNLLIAYDVKNKIPLMYRTYRGSSTVSLKSPSNRQGSPYSVKAKGAGVSLALYFKDAVLVYPKWTVLLMVDLLLNTVLHMLFPVFLASCRMLPSLLRIVLDSLHLSTG